MRVSRQKEVVPTSWIQKTFDLRASRDAEGVKRSNVEKIGQIHPLSKERSLKTQLELSKTDSVGIETSLQPKVPLSFVFLVFLT